MWFRFPDGVDNISVQQQNFRPEFEDRDGGKFFRAPDHFAPIILDLTGFSRVTTPPEGAPADLPLEDTEASRALGDLASQVDAQKIEITNLKSDNSVLIRERDALESERGGLIAELKALKTENESAKPEPGGLILSGGGPGKK